MMSRLLAGAALLFVAPALWAAGALEGEVVKQAEAAGILMRFDQNLVQK